MLLFDLLRIQQYTVNTTYNKTNIDDVGLKRRNPEPKSGV